MNKTHKNVFMTAMGVFDCVRKYGGKINPDSLTITLPNGKILDMNDNKEIVVDGEIVARFLGAGKQPKSELEKVEAMFVAVSPTTISNQQEVSDAS
jgi:hypothetical protein